LLQLWPESVDSSLSLSFGYCAIVSPGAGCIQALGDVHVRLSEYAEARARYEEALPIYRAIGDRLGEANCHFGLGNVARGEQDWAEAKRFFQTALKVYQTTRMPFNIGLALWRLGNVAASQKQQDEASGYYREALQIFETIGVEAVAEFVRTDLQKLE
jgi:tetratricopeptide (TPR) repeat protein